LRAICQFTDCAVQARMVYIHVLFVILYQIYGLKKQLFNYINTLLY